MSFKLTDFITVTSTGNVGIGTISPSGKLHVASSGGADGLRINAGTSSSNNAFVVNNEADNATLFYIRGNGDASFGSKLDITTSVSGFASTITNNKDDSQGLLVRTSDNDGGEYILDLQSSTSSTGTDYSSKFNVAKGGNATFTGLINANQGVAVVDTTAGSAGTPQFKTLLSYQYSNVNALSTIKGGNEASGTNGTYLKFYVNSKDAVNTPLNLLTLQSSFVNGTNATFSGSAGDINSDIANGNLVILNGGSITTAGHGVGIQFARAGSQLGFIAAGRENTTNEASFLSFATQTSAGAHPEAMRITSGGIVGIGSTGVFAGSAAILNLQGSGIALKNDKNGSNNNWSYIQNTGTSNNSDINFYTGNNPSALNLSHSGDAQFTSVKGSGESLNVKILDSNTNYAQGTGGGLLFQGIFQNNGNIAGGGAIQISKVNSTNGDYSYDMDFYTRPLGSALAKRLTITSTGAIAVGSSSTNYGSSGQVLTSNGNAAPSWTSVSGAKGEPGGTGAQGTAGSNGSNGAQGTAGSNGSNGALGSQGTNGSTGAQGAVGLNGGTGAQGATGATGGGGGTGAQGTAGSNGSNGGTGAQGATGATGGGGGTGAQGIAGSNGGTGAQGTAGSNGSNGSNGGTGAQGATGNTGNTGSTGSTGGTGGTGAQGTSGVTTFPYTTGSWATFGNNMGGSSYPSTAGLTIGWNPSNGSQETVIFFKGNSNTSYKKLNFIAGQYSGASYYTKQVFQMTSTRIYCGSGGNLPISANAFTNTSDYRLKENIILLTGALARVLQLKPSRFNFIDKPNVTIDGFIAHEVSSVVPEAVDGVKDDVERWEEMDVTPDGEAPVGASVGDPKLDENGNEIPYYQGVDLSKMVPILTAAIQEQQVLINDLTARIEALEG